MNNYFKLSDVKNEIPHVLSQSLNCVDNSMRQTIREFLGSNYKTNFFDNLDNFVGCVKTLYSNSKMNSAKMDRVFHRKTGTIDFENVKNLEMKFVDDIRNRSIRLCQEMRLQKIIKNT